MTLEELNEKVKKDEIAAQDIFEYFQVRNIEGLEMALEEKSKVVNPRMDYITASFPFIFAARKGEYNPVQEKFFYFTTVLPSFYDIQPEEVNAMARAFGVFNLILMLDKIFKDRDEIKYYNELLKNYYEHQESLSRVMQEGFKDLTKFLDEKLKDFKLEDLQKLGDKVLGEVGNLRNRQ